MAHRADGLSDIFENDVLVRANLTAAKFFIGTLTFSGGSITDSTGAISFGNENLTTTGTGTFGNLDIDTLNFNGNVITDSTGFIDFGDEVLSTTGTISMGQCSATSVWTGSVFCTGIGIGNSAVANYPLTAWQTQDNKGIRLYGYDDESTHYGELYIDDDRAANFNSDVSFSFRQRGDNKIAVAASYTYFYQPIRTYNVYPVSDNTYYLGKNDDDNPLAYKGVILKDTTDGNYYRIQVTNGVVEAIDLSD